ncbi:MAG TPA: alpha-glucosidase, partial [Flavobacterium sp.]|nr:alpha-glucosidase [Flavobacterium sp.]
MKNFLSLSLIFVMNMVYSQNIKSPSNKISVNFELTTDGQPSYSVYYNNKPVIFASTLGIKLKDKTALDANFEIADTKTNSFNESWKPVLGEQATIVNHYNELTVSLIQKGTKIKMNIIFRVFDEGVAFRYDFPKQKDLNYFIISDEVSQFNLTENNKVFWIPGDYD